MEKSTMKILKVCNRAIEYSFYALFLLVHLVLTSDTSELFEFNKMWLTFGLTILIAAAWFTKMILQRKIYIQRTPLDIPIGLFLLSQIISTIFSWDTHVSLWGYYSRFNGGLLSILSYIFLYYALVSNFYTEAREGKPPTSEHERRQNATNNNFNIKKDVRLASGQRMNSKEKFGERHLATRERRPAIA